MQGWDFIYYRFMICVQLPIYCALFCCVIYLVANLRRLFCAVHGIALSLLDCINNHSLLHFNTVAECNAGLMIRPANLGLPLAQVAEIVGQRPRMLQMYD